MTNKVTFNSKHIKQYEFECRIFVYFDRWYIVNDATEHDRLNRAVMSTRPVTLDVEEIDMPKEVVHTRGLK